MEMQRLELDDSRSVADWAELRSAIAAVDSPWEHPETPAMVRGYFNHGWDGEPATPYLVRIDGRAVAWGTVSTSEYDNLDLAAVHLGVHPDLRRRGLGSTVLTAMLDEVRQRGRRSVVVDAWESDAAEGFARRHGFERKLSVINRRQVLADIDWLELGRRHDAALPHARDYVIQRWDLPTPDPLLAELAEMAASINDAPLDDLDYEDEVFTDARMRAYEVATAGRGLRMYRLVARHEPTGALAAQTVVCVSEEDPTWADQHDTSVLEAHRGHRLGLLLKAEMMRWLRDAEPRLEVIDTFNAESNDHMIGVNEVLGYQVMGRELAYQRSI